MVWTEQLKRIKKRGLWKRHCREGGEAITRPCRDVEPLLYPSRDPLGSECTKEWDRGKYFPIIDFAHGSRVAFRVTDYDVYWAVSPEQAPYHMTSGTPHSRESMRPQAETKHRTSVRGQSRSALSGRSHSDGWSEHWSHVASEDENQASHTDAPWGMTEHARQTPASTNAWGSKKTMGSLTRVPAGQSRKERPTVLEETAGWGWHTDQEPWDQIRERSGVSFLAKMVGQGLNLPSHQKQRKMDKTVKSTILWKTPAISHQDQWFLTIANHPQTNQTTRKRTTTEVKWLKKKVPMKNLGSCKIVLFHPVFAFLC